MRRKGLLANPYAFATSAFLVGMLLAPELSNEEQNSIGNWLQLVGLSIQTYSSQDVNSISTEPKDANSFDIDSIKRAIQKIEKELENLSQDC